MEFEQAKNNLNTNGYLNIDLPKKMDFASEIKKLKKEIND